MNQLKKTITIVMDEMEATAVLALLCNAVVQMAELLPGLSCKSCNPQAAMLLDVSARMLAAAGDVASRFPDSPSTKPFKHNHAEVMKLIEALKEKPGCSDDEVCDLSRVM